MEKIKVKSYMTKKATPEFDFMEKWNNNNPMPLRIMVGEKIKETPGMVYMKLHGDITSTQTQVCMKCGRPITNNVSKYFGMGPECGGHSYVNPFNSEEELKEAVEAYRRTLNQITWEGWIIKSAIEGYESLDNTETTQEVKEETKVRVNITIKDSVKVNGEQAAFISFPYNERLVSLIRQQSSRYWHPDTKEWEIPAHKLESLLPELSNYDVKVTGEYRKPEPITDVQIPEGFEFKTNPYSFQLEGFKFGLTHDKFLLGDEQGTGKTKQSIDIAMAKKVERNYPHCLVICCVNGTKWNWQKEIEIHSNETGCILGTSGKKKSTGNISTKDKLQDLYNLPNDYFLITNIESLRDEEIARKLKELCDNKTIGMVVVDEIHKCRNSASQQTKGLLKIFAETQIALTGTPLMNNPIDLYVILKWLGYEKHSAYQFKNHYCVMGGYGGYEVVGYRNLDELQENLNRVMLRRLKKDVLDLPEKVYSTEYVEMSAKQAVIYKEVMQVIKSNIDKIKINSNPLEQLIRLRQATGFTGILSDKILESAKLDRLEELVADVVESGDKALIFSNWTEMTHIIEERLTKYNPAVITGETKDRVEQESKFMTDKSCKCIIGTIGAMGTGLTLTAGSTVIFVDEPWNRGNKEQAEDRAHRIGTKSNVNIISLITKDTIDERIHEIIYKKGLMADMLVDGKTDIDRSQLVDYLIS